MLWGVAHVSPSPLGWSPNFLKFGLGFVEFVEREVEQYLVKFVWRNALVECNAEHVEATVGVGRPAGRGHATGAAAQISFARAVEAFQGIAGLRDEGIIVTVKQAGRITARDGLDVLNEAAQIGATAALGCLATTAGQEVEESAPNGLAVRRRLIGPQDRLDAQEHRQATDDALGQGLSFGRGLQDATQFLEVGPRPFFFRAALSVACATRSIPS